MGKYVEQNIGRGETVVKKAELNGLFLVATWIWGILLCLLIFPLIDAIVKTVQFYHIELAVTSKRVIGKTGVVNTKAMDCPLNKVQNISVAQSLGGKIFNYSTIEILSAARKYRFGGIKHGNDFKAALMAQIDQFEEDRLNQQAEKMASAMAGAINQR